MWCCMYPSIFRFKKLVEDQREIENNNNNNNDINHTSHGNDVTNINIHNISQHDTASITNNVEEFKLLFRTQEKACYELRSENTILKMKLEVANEMIQIQSKKIKSLKLKKNNLKIENNIYKNILHGSSLSLNHQHHNNNNNSNKYIKNEDQEQSCNTTNPHVYAYPPPPPPPLPLPPPNKKKDSGNFLMNNVLDELKSKIKIID